MWTPQEEAPCASWFIETKCDTQVQRWFETDGRNGLCLRRTLPASINDVGGLGVVVRSDSSCIKFCGLLPHPQNFMFNVVIISSSSSSPDKNRLGLSLVCKVDAVSLTNQT
ncbi:hypothetical protein AVEN_140885-1 [Araneus ventricosus]|uniref:Uncharacterized protein n=1 Tax=Araneus ventricosus TaxID=182803 RepID=A0A4Y2TUI8_ARAVE|nr:hypothetical protein AVEN_140885-1 [Araneus ventricosus]